jgi:hypothetical protein
MSVGKIRMLDGLVSTHCNYWVFLIILLMLLVFLVDIRDIVDVDIECSLVRPACLFCKVAPLGRKRAYTGCTQTTAVPAEPGIPWRVSHPSFIQAQCCLTSVFEWELVYPTLPALFWLSNYVTSHHLALVPQSGANN